MKTTGVIVTVIGAFTLISGLSMLVVMRLPYYRDAVRRQGDPARARKNMARAIVLGLIALIVGITLAAIGS